jgi:hypothetical protein
LQSETKHATLDVLPTGEDAPAGQLRHADTAVVVEYVPAMHCVHNSLPLELLYFPTTHAVHGPPVGPVYPGSQATIQAAIDELATAEIKPVVHTVHWAVPVTSL